LKELLTEFEIGYAIRLIAGEGCFTKWKRGRPHIVVALAADDPLPLEWMLQRFGGTIYGPYQNRGKGSLRYYLTGQEAVDMARLIEEWLPPCRKRQQFDEWKLNLKEFTPVGDGNWKVKRVFPQEDNSK
jgi:hypothetical protein